MKKVLLQILMAFCVFSVTAGASAQNSEDTAMNTEKLSMTDTGIVRLSKIEVYPEYLEEYLTCAKNPAF